MIPVTSSRLHQFAGNIKVCTQTSDIRTRRNVRNLSSRRFTPVTVCTVPSNTPNSLPCKGESPSPCQPPFSIIRVVHRLSHHHSYHHRCRCRPVLLLFSYCQLHEGTTQACMLVYSLVCCQFNGTSAQLEAVDIRE